MQTYEYLVVTADNKIQRVVADSIKGVLEAVDEESVPIINIFRNVEITQGGVSEKATVGTAVHPTTAFETGCRAYPNIPVQTAQGKQITLSAVHLPGWKFDGWFVGDTQVATTEQATILNQFAGEVTYVAHFSPSA
jgi:uncharacterized repeat protein (TIGR02543 family)